MIVAGGTYRERVITTGYDVDLGGSAFRASLAAPSTTSLVTAVEPTMTPVLLGAAKTFSLDIDDVGRDQSVGFTYLSEFLEPSLQGRSARFLRPVALQGDAGLVFGVVEGGSRSIDIARLVYDPQSTDDPALRVLAEATFDRGVMCANVQEVEAIGAGATLVESAQAIRAAAGLEAVVVKAGARGCFVVDSRRMEWIGAVPSSTVRKVGSGDIFSASFAHAWTAGADVVDAARIASHATSWWVRSEVDRIPEHVLEFEYRDTSGFAELANAGRSPKIYLAGPFFTAAEYWLVSRCRIFLQHAGADVFSPVHDVGLGGTEVALKDLEGLAPADAVFAILDGWDPGTLFETGWANRAAIPVVAAASRLDTVNTTMLAGTGAELYTDFTTAMYRAIWRGLGVETNGAAR